MLTSSPVIYSISPKSIKLTILFLLTPLFFFAQSLTGLWVGTISNDSNTVRKDQSFEIALTEYRGKVYGYSRSEFIVDDVLYYIMKRVKGTIEGDVCEVHDDEIISFNFPTKLDKGVKVTSTFYRNKNDGKWYLAGTWKTNQTKKYYALTGKVDLEEEKDLTASKIFPHLEELKLADDVAFYKDRKESEAIVKIAKPEKLKAEFSTKVPPSNNTAALAVSTKPSFQKAPVNIVSVESTPATTATTTESKKPEVIAASNEKTTGIVKTEPGEKLTVSKESATVSTKPDTKNFPVTTSPVTSAMAPEVIPEVQKTTAATSSTKPDTKSIVINTAPGISTASPQTNAETKNTSTTSSSVRPNTVAVNNPSVEKKERKSEPIAKAAVKQNQPVAKNQQPVTARQVDAIQKKPEANSVVVTTAPAKINSEPVKTNVTPATVKTITVSTTSPATEKKEIKTETAVTPLTPEIKKPDADITLKVALIAGRKSEFSQVVNFKADSLELSLYDNGEVDGDTVTIFMNGEAILSRQGLKASAIKKTIYITPGNEDFTLVMFAENLGKYPPNTGLLVVHDGDDIYNLRFSSDFQKSAGIVFRRKK